MVLGIMIFKNVLVYCGYELFLWGMMCNLILKYLIMVMYYDMYYEKVNGNYGFYFIWWDCWMGIEYVDYEV